MRHTTLRATAGALALTTMLGGLASGQGLLQFHGQMLGATNETPPGLVAGELYVNSFDSPVMDDAGNVLFRGRFSGGGTLTTNDRAYFYGNTKSGLQLLLRAGDPEPSGTIPGATMNSTSSSGLSSGPRISGSGDWIFFGTTLNDGGINITTANDTAIYVGKPGGLWKVLVREGDAAFGTIGATYSSSFSSPSQQQTCINPSGRVFFKSSLTGGDVSGTLNNEAMYTGTVNGLELIFRKGDLFPGGEQIDRLTPGFVSQMNASGQILFDIGYVQGTGLPVISSTNDRGLFVFTPGLGSQEILREGDASPIAGATHNNASDTWSVNTGASTFNAAGEVLIRSDLTGAVSAGIDDSIIVKVSASGQSLVARRGDTAPGLPGFSLEVFNNTSLQLADSGFVAFQSTIGGPVTTTDDSAIFAGMPGSLVMVAREGDVAPGTGGGVFGSVSGQSMQMNNAGQILFSNTIIGGTNPGSSLWAWDPQLGLAPVYLNSESIEVSPGVFAPITSGAGVQFNNGSSRPLSFHDDGTFALRVGFSGSLGGIAKGHVGSLFAHDATISVAAGGVHKLFVNGGAANAGLDYLVAGSLANTPGFTVNGVHVPLNADPYFFLSIQFANVGAYSNTLGNLDSQGRAAASITIPAGLGSIVGLTLHHAWMGFNPFTALVFGSEPSSVTFVP